MRKKILVSQRFLSLLMVILLFFSSVAIFPIQAHLDLLAQDKTYQHNMEQSKSLSSSFDLLIITPQAFSSYLTPLVNHKDETGMQTKLTLVEDIYQQELNNGRDNAEKIKYYIKEAKEEWNISFVLLVGGRKGQGATEEWWIPVRYSFLERNYGHWEEKKFLTDLYFADLYDEQGNFSSWDDNENGKYGEWAKNDAAADTPDLYPDVAVGRIPCRTPWDVIIAVNKIISYETGDFSDNWFKKIAVIAGDTYPKKTPGFIDGEVHTQQALEFMTDFTPVKRWVSDGTLTNWIDVVTAINNGCGFVFFSGHGGPHLWATYPPENAEAWGASFHLRHMPFLVNKDKLPVCVSASGCFNNMFNVSLGHSDWVYMHPLGIPIKYNVYRCWGEQLLLKPIGGCISVIASTAFSYESSDIGSKQGGCEWLDIHFFEQYNVNNKDVLGSCWKETVTAFLQNFTINWADNTDTGDALILKNVEQWLLLGDPSLRIGGI